MMRIVARKSVDNYAPLNFVDKTDKPILFMYSKLDEFCKPDKAEILFDRCSSNRKKLVFFDKGVHSHVRINATEKYDDTIREFIRENIKA